MSDSDSIPWKPFPHYEPSIVLAAIFAGLFGVTTLLHSYQLYRKRTWYFIPLVIGGIMEVLGFIVRILCRPNNFSILGPFLVQAIFILIAPALFAASIYIVLGRIILLVDGERYSWMRQKHLTAAFVAGDIISLNLQANGGGFVSNDNPNLVLVGRIVIIIGLFAQLFFFGLFVIVSAVFHYRLIHDKPVRKHISFFWVHRLRHFNPVYWKNRGKYKETRMQHRSGTERPSSSTYLTQHEESGGGDGNLRIPGTAVDLDTLPWRRHIYVLYTTSVLIFVRSVFRLVEYIEGEDGYLLSNEVYLYALDAALMVVVMVLFNVVHPGQITDLIAERKKSRSVDREGQGVELQRRS